MTAPTPVLVDWQDMRDGCVAMTSSADEFHAVWAAWRTWFYDAFPESHAHFLNGHHRASKPTSTGCGCYRAGPIRVAPLDESGHRFLAELLVLDNGSPVRSDGDPDELVTERAEVTTTIQLPPVLMGAMVHAVTTARRRTLDAI